MLSGKLNYTLSGMQMSCDTTSFHVKGSLLTLTRTTLAPEPRPHYSILGIIFLKTYLMQVGF